MENKFEYTRQSIAEATQYLKDNNDYFYKNVNAWLVLTKNETEFVTNGDILDTANLLYKNLNT
jgi:hypothetical protein